MPKMSQSEAFRLYTHGEMRDQTARGTNITSGITGCSVNKATWTLTFDQDWTDVDTDIVDLSHVGAYTAPQMYAKGSYDTGGVASIVTKAFDPGTGEGSLYYQGAASELWMGAGNFTAGSSTGNKCTSLESGRQQLGSNVHAVEDGTTEISEGFYQRYGLFEARLKLPPVFRSDVAVMWPAFWLYSDRWAMPDKPLLEIDQFEIYQGSTNNITYGDGAWHQSLHTHDSYKGLLAPGYIAKDYNSSNILTMRGNATWGFGPTFDWGDDFHNFQFYITPEYMYSALDDLVMTRYWTYDAYHTKLYMLLSLWVNQFFVGAGAKLGVTGFIQDTPVWLKCDWLRCYQNPDWDDLAIGGTANVKTVTTGLAMASYAAGDGRIVVGIANTANTTTTPTLNANGLGAKTIKKYSDYDGVKNGPYTGTMVALAANDILTTGSTVLKWSLANDCWILLNPANPFSEPHCYVPPAYAQSAITIDTQAVEGKIMEEWNKLSLLPDEHTGKDTLVDPTLVSPRVLPNYSFTLVITRPAGTVVGIVPYNNTPSSRPRASISTTSKYQVDPETGQITVKAGAILSEGIDEFEISWWAPGVPTKRGANVSTVAVTVLADVAFDLAAYFGLNLAGAWEFDKTANLTITSNAVETVLDSSSYAHTATQAVAGQRPPWSATGLNGFPAVVSVATSPNDYLDIATPLLTPANSNNGIFFWNDGTASVQLNTVHRHTVPYDYTQIHSVYFEWTSLEAFCWVNGSPVTVVQQPGTITAVGWMLAFCQVSPPSGTSVNLYVCNEADARLFARMDGSSGFTGACGLIACGKTNNTVAGREKAIADAHWRWGKQSLLPVGHTYKLIAPTLYG